MANVDQMIVDMQFNNQKFEKHAHQTIDTLGQLEKGLNFQNAGKGLDGIATNVQNISSKFSAFGAIGFTVLQNLTNAALNAGKTLVGSVLGPIVEGGQRRAQNIEAAEFALKGLVGTMGRAERATEQTNGKLKYLSKGDWVKEIKENAMAAVDGTAYGFDAAAKAASQLAASGVRAGVDMTGALRGISGLAAQTNSSYEDISSVFTKVAGQGRLMGDDLNRIGVRGVNAAAVLAKQMGKTEKEVRDMVSKGKIDFQTFADAMNTAFGDNAMKANETFSGAMSNVNAALARIGQAPAETYFESLRKIFVKLIPVINTIKNALTPLFKIIDTQANLAIKPLTKFLDTLKFDEKDTKKTGKNGKAFVSIIKTIIDTILIAAGIVGTYGNIIKLSLEQIFPPMSIENVKSLVDGFKSFVEGLKPTTSTLMYVGSIAKGVFAIFSIGIEIIKQVAGVISELFAHATQGNTFMKTLADIGLFFVGLNDQIKNGEGFSKFFDDLTEALKRPIDSLKQLGQWFSTVMKNALVSVSEFFGTFGSFDLNGLIAKIQEFFASFGNGSEEASARWEKFTAIFAKVWEIISPVANKVGEIFTQLGGKIRDAFSNLGLSSLTVGMGIGTLVLVGDAVMKFFQNLNNMTAQGSGMVNRIRQIFIGLQTNLQVMQNSIKANMIRDIAAALLILAAAVLILSTINPVDLTVAMVAIKIMLVELMSALAVFDKLSTTKQVASMSAMAWSLILLSTAVLILASAVKKLSSLNWQEMAVGIVAVSALLGALTLFTKFAQANKGAMAQGAGLILLALAINILADAVAKFAGMSLEALGKGLGSLTAVLILLGGFSKLAGGSKGMISIGIGMVLVAKSMDMLADAVGKFGGMSLEVLGKGIVAIGVAMAILAGTMNLMPKDLILRAAGLVIVAAALTTLQTVMASFGGMSWDELIHAFVGLAGALVIIAGAMFLMQSALAGATALIIVAGALAILAQIIATFSGMSWEEIGKGLLMLAGVFVVIGLAGLALTPVIPTLLGLGVAIGLIGVGAALAGVGIFLFSTALLALAGAGAGAAVGLTVMVTSLISLIPLAMKAIGEGIIEIVKVISESGVAITEAMVTVILALCDAINQTAPEVIDTLVDLVMKLVDTLVSNVPKLVDSGMKLILGILQGIANNIGQITEVALKIISEFINGIAAGLPGVIESAANLIITFVNSLADTIDSKAEEMGRAGGRLAMAIINGMVKGITGGIDEVVKAARKMAEDALNAAKRLLGIASPSKEFERIGEFVTQGFAKGIRGGIPMDEVIKSEIAEAFDALKQELKDFIKETEKDVKSAQAKVNKLKKKKKKSKKDKTALKEAKAELKQAKDEVNAAKKAQTELSKLRKAEEKELERLSKAYAENSAALEEANELLDLRNQYAASVKNQFNALPGFTDSKAYFAALDEVQAKYADITNSVNEAEQALLDAKQAMIDTARSIKEQYSKLPSMDQDTTYETYVEDLQNRIKATAQFRKDLATLRSIGLDDETYAALLDQGLDAQPFVTKLLESGPDGLTQIKRLYDELGTEAGYLGSTVSQEFYQAGVDSAQALVDGLKSQQEAVAKEVEATSGSYVDGFKKDLEKQIADNKKLAADLAALRNLGLSDEAYKNLVAKGVDAQPFITDLLSKGKSGVAGINSLIQELDSTATKLGDTAADEMYKAGVQTAQGLVDGLKKKENEIVAQMDKIAGSMVNTIKKKLGIKSPSREAIKVGDYFVEGLVKSLSSSIGAVSQASKDVGDVALEALKNSLSDLTSIVSGEMDMNPTIRPILDLTDVKTKAGMIDGLISPPSISVGSAYTKASMISAENLSRASDQLQNDRETATSSGDSLSFTQHNYSPKALSAGEIYRQTRNQISIAQKGLRK